MKRYLAYAAKLLVLCSAFQLTAVPNGSYSDETNRILTRLQKQIDASLYAIADEREKQNKSMDGFYYAIEKPASQTVNLGVVLDTQNIKNKFKISSVTLGSIAEKNGLKTGDEITAISGIDITEENKQSTFDRLIELKINTVLDLNISDVNGKRKVSIPVVGKFRPSIKMEIGKKSIQVAQAENDNKDENESSACGEISVFFTPPVTKDLYPVFVNGIDGDGALRSRQTFRLSPGKHTIRLHELISSRENIRRGKAMQISKPIVIHVDKDTSYHLAAKFNRSKRYKTRKGEYWEPVVWRIKKLMKECEL